MTKKIIYNNTSGVVYGLGFVGALIYEIQHATGALDILIGIFKSIVWPAFLTFRLFQFFRI